jgi:hypothetical protein
VPWPNLPNQWLSKIKQYSTWNNLRMGPTWFWMINKFKVKIFLQFSIPL